MNQMIRDTRFEVPIWIKRFANHHFRLGCRSANHESFNSHNDSMLQSPNLNQMIRDSRSEVPIWIMIREPSFQIRTRSSDCEPFNFRNDSQTHSEVSVWIKWFAIRKLQYDTLLWCKMQLEGRQWFFSIGINSRNSKCLCFVLFMDAQIGQTEEIKGAFIVYENVLFMRGERQEMDWKTQEKVTCKPASAVRKRRVR